MNRALVTCAVLFAALLAQPGMAADAGHGKALHDKNCTSCHDDKVYTRQDRKVTTAAGLQKQVQRCELTLGLKWFDEDIEDVAAHLNETYYHFK